MKNLADLTMDSAYDILDTMNDEDAEELGFAFALVIWTLLKIICQEIFLEKIIYFLM